MHKLDRDAYLLPLTPRFGVNAYLLGDVLVDAGARQSRRCIERMLRGHRVSAHALTHVHPDHQGASHALCRRHGWPLWCGAADVPAMESGEMPLPPRRLARLVDALCSGPPHPVSRALSEGDVVGGFEVIETPGHTAGHLAYWREAGRVLILGDVLNGMHLVTTIPGLREPPEVFSVDAAQNRASARLLRGLRPEVVAFGHGPPLRDPERFEAFLDALPA
ncbi:MAG: MBL fold metallo-hydrolase [Bacteroidota bacterium]